MSVKTRRIALILFAQDWDVMALPNLRRRYGDWEWVTVGFDLFKFPQNAKLLWFDPERFVNQLIARFGEQNIVTVMSTHEQFGALCAALLAEKCGLPGTAVNAVLTAQHKAFAREIHGKVMPQAVPQYQVFTYGQDAVAQVSLSYPFFVKPVKAAYSVLAKQVDTPQDLQAHTQFGSLEKHIIKRLTKPFNSLVKQRLPTAIDGDYMMAETLMTGEQVNVDGYAFDGEVNILGVVDAVMYPGTQAFMRFEMPSRLSPQALAKVKATAKLAIESIGFNHGLFNVELFWDAKNEQAKIIEINPRMAAQFADLYEKAFGVNLYEVLLSISNGQKPDLQHLQPRYGAAASFVYRVFDETVKYPPQESELEWLKTHYPDAIFTPDFKYGASRQREQRWLGSHRYALLNLGANDHDDLMAHYRHINNHINFDRAPQGLKGVLHALRRSV